MACVTKAHEAAFMKELRCLDPQKYIEKYFLYSAAPIIAGVKPSALISFRHCCRDAWQACKAQLCTATGLHTLVLYENKGTFGVLIYDQSALALRIRSPAAKRVLHRYGYADDMSLFAAFEFLKERLTNNSFPHEIGVFLGYPPEDVSAFIENQGKGYLCCHYWKVYSDEQSAREAFRCIDAARSQAIHLLNRKITIETAAKMLSQMKTA